MTAKVPQVAAVAVVGAVLEAMNHPGPTVVTDVPVWSLVPRPIAEVGDVDATWKMSGMFISEEKTFGLKTMVPR